MVLVEVVNQETKGREEYWNKIQKSAQEDLLVEEEFLKERKEEEQEEVAPTLPP